MTNIPEEWYARATSSDGPELLAKLLDEWTAAYNLPYSSGDPFQDAISERLERLFPDDFISNLDEDACWVDLPPRLLQNGELNLLHEPSIFADPFYNPGVFLTQRGMLPADLDPEPINTVAAMTAFNAPVQRGRRRRQPLERVATSHFKRMPRSLFTSPKRNAGVLFRLNQTIGLSRSTFNTAMEAKDYFEARLGRLPASIDRGVPQRSQGPLKSLRSLTAPRNNYGEILWSNLSDGVYNIWCERPRDVDQVVSLFTSTKETDNGRVHKDALEYLETRGGWHANCASEDRCPWRDNNATRSWRNNMNWGSPQHEHRRQYAYTASCRVLPSVLKPEDPMPPSAMGWGRRLARTRDRSGKILLYPSWHSARASHFKEFL